ncbi:MAG: efflux RND transporter periplasmic adaptor subunit [Silvanigrellaceae bacterium]|nr:efflux RND transporter periplasmic adaptor subunit [Silvanigrellaceae bacterium]
MLLKKRKFIASFFLMSVFLNSCLQDKKVGIDNLDTKKKAFITSPAKQTESHSQQTLQVEPQAATAAVVLPTPGGAELESLAHATGGDLKNNQETPSHEPEANTVLRVSGSVIAPHTSQLSFQTRGFISGQYVDVGDKFKMGALIAQLDDRDALLNVKLKKDGLNLAKLTAQQAKKDFLRSETLLKQNAISQYELEAAENALKSAELSVSQAQTNLQIAEKNFQDTKMFAPFDGVVLNRSKALKEFVSEGIPVFSVFKSTNLEISVELPEKLIKKVKTGQQYPLSIPSIQATGTLVILRVVPKISEATRTFEIRGSSSDLKDKLVPGQFVEVKF